MKKILFLFWALVTSLGIMAATDFEEDGISYAVLSEDGLTAEVIYNNGAYVGDVTIPARVTHDGKTYTVTALHKQAFFKCTELYAVSIPATVTDLGEYTFSGCTNLASLELPESLTAIPNGTFYGCTALTSVMLPETVETLGDYCFATCTSLSQIDMPATLTTIGKAALMGTGLEQFTLPEGVTELSAYALSFTTQLTSVTLHEGTTTIGECALQGSTALKTVTLPASLQTIDASAFAQCLTLETITIPDGITALPDKCFYNDMCLQRIVVGSGVTTIGTDCFARYKTTTTAPRLADVYLTAPTMVSGGESFLDEACAQATLHVPETLVDAYKAQTDWARFGSVVAISDGELSGISDITLQPASGDGRAYTLDGRLASKNQRGIVIVNGRKTIRK